MWLWQNHPHRFIHAVYRCINPTRRQSGRKIQNIPNPISMLPSGHNRRCPHLLFPPLPLGRESLLELLLFRSNHSQRPPFVLIFVDIHLNFQTHTPPPPYIFFGRHPRDGNRGMSDKHKIFLVNDKIQYPDTNPYPLRHFLLLSPSSSPLVLPASLFFVGQANSLSSRAESNTYFVWGTAPVLKHPFTLYLLRHHLKPNQTPILPFFLEKVSEAELWEFSQAGFVDCVYVFVYLCTKFYFLYICVYICI